MFIKNPQFAVPTPNTYVSRFGHATSIVVIVDALVVGFN
jgi:hypothetical protein